MHPPKQTWNLKMGAPWKRRFLLESIISRFHVEFPGVYIVDLRNPQLAPDSIRICRIEFEIETHLDGLLAAPVDLEPSIWRYWNQKNIQGNTLQGINISHLGKRKIIFKMPFLGDMLVSWRVIFGIHGCLLFFAEKFFRPKMGKKGWRYIFANLIFLDQNLRFLFVLETPKGRPGGVCCFTHQAHSSIPSNPAGDVSSKPSPPASPKSGPPGCRPRFFPRGKGSKGQSSKKGCNSPVKRWKNPVGIFRDSKVPCLLQKLERIRKDFCWNLGKTREINWTFEKRSW